MNRAGDPLPNLFAHAASWLLNESPEDIGDPDVGLLFEALGYASAGFPISGCETDPEFLHRGYLLKAASQLERVFELTASAAPGLVSVGAEFDPGLADSMHVGSPKVGVSGVGLSLQEAFQGCIGEAVEYLSQLQTAHDVLELVEPGDPIGGLGQQGKDFLAAFSAYRLCTERELSWHCATRLANGGQVLLPADLCLRRAPEQRKSGHRFR